MFACPSENRLIEAGILDAIETAGQTVAMELNLELQTNASGQEVCLINGEPVLSTNNRDFTVTSDAIIIFTGELLALRE